ncbi:MAG: ATP-binding protein [Candidatus Cloacimonetes bacterium]|nr:ATP-binding protein [Candidatus Cloacimonadota bacterium]
MFYLKDNPKENCHFIYLETESVNTENEFYRRLLSKLVTSEFVKKHHIIWNFISEHLPVIKKIGTNGVEFDSKSDHNFREAFLSILKKNELDDQKLIFLLDEFSQTVENIKDDNGENRAIRFLQSNREIRQSDEISKNIQFIYSGSIGLENIVKRINASKTINDIVPLKIKPFTQKESIEFITLLLENVDFGLEESQLDTILEKVEWLIPFYLQLSIQAINDISKEENLTEITKDVIDRAFDEMIEKRNYFDPWHTRLRTFLKGSEYNFAKELLNRVANPKSKKIHSNEIFDLSTKYEIEDYKDIIGSLVYDGYINNNEDLEIYRFNSPILRMWWWKYVAN